MKSGRNRLMGTTLLAFALASATAAQEKAVKMKELPPAVQATVKEQSKGAKLRGLGMETKDGKTVYEAELLVRGRGKDILMDASGNVIEVEEQVALNSLPPAVKAAIRKQAGKRRVVLVESVTRSGSLEFYEAHIKSGARIEEAKISPEGKLIP